MRDPRGTTTQRGLGGEHQRLRRLLLPKAYGKLCELCGEVMLEGQMLNLDHETPRVYGGHGRMRITHQYCNVAAGARLGAQRRRQRGIVQQQIRSRTW